MCYLFSKSNKVVNLLGPDRNLSSEITKLYLIVELKISLESQSISSEHKEVYIN